MALSSINPSKSSLLIHENYTRILNQSIQSLLNELPNNPSDLSQFNVVFSELMQSRTDPPLETIWAYSALNFRGRKIAEDDLLSRLSAVKDLFQLISRSSAPCSAHKCIALLAPVVFQLYGLLVELLGRDMSSKRTKKVVKEVKSFIGVILGYVSVCCCKDMSDESDSSFHVRFADLVGMWMDRKEGLKAFLPLVSNEIFEEFNLLQCSVNYLAGIVIAELLLLKLYLDLCVGDRGLELERQLRSWVVGYISGTRSFYFFETLVKMLLEPTLPITPFLSSGDEILSRTVLYDAAILVEYSFLQPENAIQLPDERMRSLAMQRLIVTYEAIEYFRKAGDQNRAISHTSSFSASRLPSQIIKCVTSKIGKESEASRLIGSSPKALIKWLLVHESEVTRLFGNSISKRCAKLANGDPKSGCELPSGNLGGTKADDLPLSYKVEKDGDDDDDENVDFVNAQLLEAAHTMRSAVNGGVKRKNRGGPGKNKRVKSLTDDISESSDSNAGNSSSVTDDSSNSEGEVENPTYVNKSHNKNHLSSNLNY